MLLKNKTAVIYGAAGSVGSAISRASALEGARVFLADRNLSRFQTVASEITAGSRWTFERVLAQISRLGGQI